VLRKFLAAWIGGVGHPATGDTAGACFRNFRAFARIQKPVGAPVVSCVAPRRAAFVCTRTSSCGAEQIGGDKRRFRLPARRLCIFGRIGPTNGYWPRLLGGWGTLERSPASHSPRSRLSYSIGHPRCSVLCRRRAPEPTQRTVTHSSPSNPPARATSAQPNFFKPCSAPKAPKRQEPSPSKPLPVPSRLEHHHHSRSAEERSGIQGAYRHVLVLDTTTPLRRLALGGMGSAGEAAFTDSADGSSSSSDAASTDEWPPVAAARKPGSCVSDTELVAKQQHNKQRRRAASGERLITSFPLPPPPSTYAQV
jgi:hypothetical protein